MKAHNEAFGPSGFTHLILPAVALAVAGPLKFTLAEAVVISFSQRARASSQRRVVYSKDFFTRWFNAEGVQNPQR